MKPVPFVRRRLWVAVLKCFAFGAVSAAAHAQSTLPTDSAGAGAAAAGVAGAPDANAAQGAATGPKRAFTIEPRLSVLETFTDNVLLKDVGKTSDEITELQAGLRMTSNSRRLTAYFDYQLRELAYAHTASKSTSLKSLNTFGTLEAIENWGFLEFSSTIARQAVSAFGSQSADNGTVNANLTETTNTRLSPYVRGLLGGVANYELRYSWTGIRNDANRAADVNVRDASLKLNGIPGGRALSWTFELDGNRTGFSSGRATADDRATVGLTYAATPQLKLSVTAGKESNDYTSLAMETHDDTGLGLNWQPSDATTVTVQRDQRFFGEGHNIALEHKSARTVWRYTDARDITANTGQSGGGSVGTIYDLLFAQFATLEPDPVKRAALVNNYLQTYGLSPTANVTGGFLSSAVTLQRRQDLSFSLLGLRDNITVVASQTESQRLDGLSGSTDDLSNSSFVRQRGFSFSLAHRLTPISSLNLLASQTDANGSNLSQKTTTKSLNLNFSTKLGEHSAAVIGARRVVFDNATSPYTESALTGSLNVQF
jgi:uncharacterized protein (PEP-CTERM system associated)